MNLQYALLLIGIVIVAVVALSAFDRTRVNRMFRSVRQSRSDTGAEPSVLMPGHGSGERLDMNPPPPGQTDPRFLAYDADAAPPERSPDEKFEAEIGVLEEVASMPLDLGGAGLRPHGRSGVEARPDEKIEFVMRLPGAGPVPRDVALGIYKQNEYMLEKPRRLFGMRCSTGDWRELQFDSARTTYDDLALSIQMVDGTGPITESELNTFSQIGLKLADALQRPTKFSMTFEEAQERARQLQKFCDVYDVIAGLNVVSGGDIPFRGRAIEKTAVDLGMHFGALNIFHMKTDLSPGCKHLFSMANLFQPGEFDPQKWDSLMTSGLTLFMSVPCAYNPAGVFDRMVETARGLCERLDGRLLDQARRPLTDKGAAVIRGQIEEIDRRMRAFGIVPGSETALRLFRASVPAVENPVAVIRDA